MLFLALFQTNIFFIRDSINVRMMTLIFSRITSQRFFVHKRNLIDTSILSSNENCCVKEKKKVSIPIRKVKSVVKIKEKTITKPDEFIVEVPKQATRPQTVSETKLALFDEIFNNSWKPSTEFVENVRITRKRCCFSNEAISIKPITAGLFIRYFVRNSPSFACSTGNR